MIAYVARRLLWTAVLLLAVSFVTFVVFTQLPSADPALLRAGKNATPEVVAAIRDQLGLDRPWYQQYLDYVAGVVGHLDLGYSYQNDVSVRSELVDRLPVTAGVALGGVVVWLAAAVPIGVVSAVRRGRLLDRVAMGSALLGLSAPVYWLGLVTLYLLSKEVGVLPVLPGAGAYPRDGGTLFTAPLEVAPTLLLPWLVLATSFAAVYARFIRASLSEALMEDFVRTARAKGLSERRVVLRHGLRFSAAPIVTLLGLDLGILLGGAILVETVFNIPGIGRLSYDAIQHSDLPMIQGTVLVGATFIIVCNLLVDLCYAALDPRVRARTA
jgi:peptide/nickel transport system permease protein